MKKTSINEAIKWWEKYRLWFNVLVGLTGIISIYPFLEFFTTIEIVYVFIWGIVANIFYSLGIIVELWDSYYFKGKIKAYRFRMLFLIFGTLAYCFVTFTTIIPYYYLIPF